MKVLYIIHNLSIGGAETIVSEYLVELKNRNADVVLIEMFESDSYLYSKLKESGIEVISLFPNITKRSLRKKLFSYMNIKLTQRIRLNKAIKGLNPDIVHLHTNFDFMDKLNIEFSHSFYTFHTSVKRSIEYPSHRFRVALYNSCLKGLKIIALSEDIKESAIEEIGECSISIIPNGIDINKIRKETVNKCEFCKKSGMPEDSFIVGHVGRFHPVKNHEKVIGIFKEIHNSMPNSFLVLIGDGDENRISKIKEMVANYGLERSVLFLGLKKDATAIMSVFDCLLLPSLVEGFSLALAEAQAHGIRCLATDKVPDEVVINDNCFKLSIDESEKKWAQLAIDNSIINRSKNIMDIDIGRIVERHIIEYKKAIEERK